MLRISNIRRGFATNSSSSHSIILMDAKGIADDLPYGDGFGWEFFTAASKEAKLRYAAQAVFIEAQKLMGDEVAAIIAKELTGIDVRNEEGEREGYIDHQSEPLIPAAWDGKGLDMAYARDLVEFLTSDGVVILGGNDNTEEKHALYNRDKQVLFLREASPALYKCLPTDDTLDDEGYLFDATAGASVPGAEDADTRIRVPDNDLLTGNFDEGRFGWMLKNVRALKNPVPAKGQRGLWDVDAALETLILVQLPTTDDRPPKTE